MLPFFFFLSRVWRDVVNGKIERRFGTQSICQQFYLQTLCSTLQLQGAGWSLTSRVLSLQGPGGEEGCLWCFLLQQDVGKQEASGRPDQGVWLMEGAGRGSCLVESPWGHALLLLVRVFGLNLHPAFTWTQVAGRGEDIPPRNKGKSP